MKVAGQRMLQSVQDIAASYAVTQWQYIEQKLSARNTIATIILKNKVA